MLPAFLRALVPGSADSCFQGEELQSTEGTVVAARNALAAFGGWPRPLLGEREPAVVPQRRWYIQAEVGSPGVFEGLSGSISAFLASMG